MTRIIYIRDAEYVELTTIAQCYQCTEAWVRDVYRAGLLGAGEVRGEVTLVPIDSLERVARILRLHLIHGLDLEVIHQLLD
jgi:hypothetical protein